MIEPSFLLRPGCRTHFCSSGMRDQLAQEAFPLFQTLPGKVAVHALSYCSDLLVAALVSNGLSIGGDFCTTINNLFFSDPIVGSLHKQMSQG